MLGVKSGRLDGWGLYLALIVCLLPLVAPAGPGRTALVDAVIVAGLVGFAGTILTRPQRVQVPFLVPVFIISVGSLAAIANAVSPGASFLAITQDAYLFLWFIMLVHLLRRRDLTAMRVTWVLVAIVIAIIGIAILMTDAHLTLLDMIRPKGRRALATFYDPNMFGGYLVMSIFMALSLGTKVSRLVKWGSILILSTALIATKSNGALLSLFAGLPAWALVRARTHRISPAALGAGVLLAATLVLGALWMNSGFDLGGRELRVLQTESFLARASRSSEGRLAIWKQLQQTYAKSPLGIGPGNSRWLSLSIDQRLRPASMASREAHNDYLAYAIERGPLGLLGLLILLAQALRKLASAAGKGGQLRPQGDPIGPLAAGLAGALIASLVHGLTVEVLHFRHFWLLLAMVCSIEGLPVSLQSESERPAGELVPSLGDRVAAA